MNALHITKYISVIIASTVKFIGGPLSGVALGLTWFETAGCTLLGMMVSVVVVTYAGTALQALLQRARRHTRAPKRFTKRTRMAIRIWKRSGLIGIAFLTPVILTPIGGTILAISFRVNRGPLLMTMLVSGIFWAIVQTLAIYQIPGLKGLISH